MPKSKTLTPPLPTMVLPGFMSWCTAPISSSRATASAMPAAAASAPSRLRSAGAAVRGSACARRKASQAASVCGLGLFKSVSQSVSPCTRSVTSAAARVGPMSSVPRKAGKGEPGGHVAPEHTSSPTDASRVAVRMAVCLAASMSAGE